MQKLTEKVDEKEIEKKRGAATERCSSPIRN
jgi:hypothetical protein